MPARPLAFAALLAFAPLAACSMSGFGSSRPTTSFETTASVKAGAVNAQEAASLISQYRRANGRSAVSVDPTLMAIARTHSDRMARADTMSHVLPGEGSFHDRLVAGGYDAGMAAENVAAGQTTLAEVLDAWRKSPSHNENLLEEHIDEIGIAVSVASGSRYKYYWTLVLGKKRPANAGTMMNGPIVTMGGAVTIQSN
jgi:uncharacterized protein YkwD